MTPPYYVGALGELEDAPNCVSYLDVLHAVALGPNAKDVFAASDAQDEAAKFLSSIQKLISNKRKQEIFPVAVRHTFFQAHDPLAASLVLVILPYRPYALLEHVVVGHGGQARGSLEVREDLPELLSRREFAERHNGLFVVDVLGCGRTVPHSPSVLEWPRRVEVGWR